MSVRIGLYGGSFDPIHFGHLISARSVAEQLGLAKVILVLSPRPPHKATAALSDADHRLAMTRLAVADDALFEVSDVELLRAGPSYTIDTVFSLRRQLGDDAELFLIIGADTLPELHTWRRIQDLLTLVTIVTTTRPGWRRPRESSLAQAVGPGSARNLLEHCRPTPAIDISSTDIRRRAASGRPIRYLVPEAVASYISREHLYC
jgi:nicotinate-nucleotide adenylyltransferase